MKLNLALDKEQARVLQSGTDFYRRELLKRIKQSVNEALQMKYADDFQMLNRIDLILLSFLLEKKEEVRRENVLIINSIPSRDPRYDVFG